jgi:hypothetical protein
MQGLATIKSFGKEAMHRERMLRFIDGSSVMQLCIQSMNRWLSVRLETIGATVSFAAAALAIEHRGAASWAGLTLSYALQLTSLTTMTVRTLNILHLTSLTTMAVCARQFSFSSSSLCTLVPRYINSGLFQGFCTPFVSHVGLFIWHANQNRKLCAYEIRMTVCAGNALVLASPPYFLMQARVPCFCFIPKSIARKLLCLSMTVSCFDQVLVYPHEACWP